MSTPDKDQLRVQVFRTGLVREGDPGIPSPDFVPNAIKQMFHHWISKALPTGLNPDDVKQALIVFGKDGRADVRVNDETRFDAAAGEQAALVDPSDVFVGQILDIWPDRVDPDLAWVGFVTAQGGRVVIGDFLRNRERVGVLLDRADEFHRSSSLSLAENLLAPAIEHLCSAAEQATMSLIQLDGWDDRRDHRRRREWLALEAEHGNVPAQFSQAFEALMGERNAARYAETSLRFDPARAEAIAEQVRAMIDYARTRRNVTSAP